MSQTETLMLVALGFALALLVALLFGRALWNMAMTMGARRNAKNIPVQMLELQADRDRLRAEHAMMSRKLELRLEGIKARMTEQMAEVSRNRNRVQSLIQRLDEREAALAIRHREVDALSSQIEVQKAELDSCATAISRLTQDNSGKDLELNKLAQSVSQLTLTLREKNDMVRRLKEELQTSLQMNKHIPASQPNADHGDGRVKRRIAELTSISDQMSNRKRGNVQTLNTPLTNMPNLSIIDAPSHQSILNGKVADTEAESAAMSQELKALDAMLDKKLGAPQPLAPEKISGAKANIISLAQRIRALQGDGE